MFQKEDLIFKKSRNLIEIKFATQRINNFIRNNIYDENSTFFMDCIAMPTHQR
jgi:hypothetical protein